MYTQTYKYIICDSKKFDIILETINFKTTKSTSMKVNSLAYYGTDFISVHMCPACDTVHVFEVIATRIAKIIDLQNDVKLGHLVLCRKTGLI